MGRRRWLATLQGALEAKWSLFSYKSFQTSHFDKKKKYIYIYIVLGCFPRQILSFLSLISPPNTSKHFRFSSFLYNHQGSVLAPNLPLLGSIPWISGLGVWMQLFSYNPHPFLFIGFPSIFLLPSISLQFFQYVSFLMPLFITLILLAQPSWARICLNLMFVLRSISFQAPCHVYVQIQMPMCSLPCLWCLCAPCHTCVLRSMLVTMPCASKALFSLYVSLSCVLALLVGCRSRSCGLGLHPFTQPYI